MAKKKYTEPREQINCWINAELLRKFDEFPGPNRTDKLNLAMQAHMNPGNMAQFDTLHLYKLDIADKYCELHQIAVVQNEVISTNNQDIHPNIQMMHIDTLKLLQNIK